MKIYKTKNWGHIFWPYLRDEGGIANKRDAKPNREKQVFMWIGTSFEGNVRQPKGTEGIGKWPYEAFRVEAEGIQFVEKLVEKVDNLEYIIGLVYEMLKLK